MKPGCSKLVKIEKYLENLISFDKFFDWFNVILSNIKRIQILQIVLSISIIITKIVLLEN